MKVNWRCFCKDTASRRGMRMRGYGYVGCEAVDASVTALTYWQRAAGGQREVRGRLHILLILHIFVPRHSALSALCNLDEFKSPDKPKETPPPRVQTARAPTRQIPSHTFLQPWPTLESVVNHEKKSVCYPRRKQKGISLPIHQNVHRRARFLLRCPHPGR